MDSPATSRSRTRHCRPIGQRQPSVEDADMNGPLGITPDRLANDAMQFHQKLAAGLKSLREVGDYDYGATAKEEVWRDGKVVLYRYVGDKTPTAKVPLLIAYALVI